MQAHTRGREDVTRMLVVVCTAGARFCSFRLGFRDGSPETYFVLLCTLVEETYKLLDIDAFSCIEDPRHLRDWIHDKMNFVSSHMFGIIDGAKAKYGTKRFGNWHINKDEAERVRDKLDALMQRLNFWHV